MAQLLAAAHSFCPRMSARCYVELLMADDLPRIPIKFLREHHRWHGDKRPCCAVLCCVQD